VSDTTITDVKITYTSDYEHFAASVRAFDDRARDMLTEHFGERCEDFDADCPCCQRWAAYDTLVENPFDEPT